MNKKTWLVIGALIGTWNVACTMPPEEPAADAGPGVTVRVSHGGTQQDVDLAGLTAVDLDGVAHARLSEVVTAAFPQLVLAEIRADFVSSDGFTPGARDFCVGLVPVDGTTLTRGYIAVETRNLAWDEDLQYPGCMRVTDTAEIQVQDL